MPKNEDELFIQLVDECNCDNSRNWYSEQEVRAKDKKIQELKDELESYKQGLNSRAKEAIALEKENTQLKEIIEEKNQFIRDTVKEAEELIKELTNKANYFEKENQELRELLKKAKNLNDIYIEFIDNLEQKEGYKSDKELLELMETKLGKKNENKINK